MAHMKRLTIPAFWPLPRKTNRFAVTPAPGPHGKYRCIPLLVLLRNSLEMAETYKEAKRVFSAGKILVDKKARKDPNFPVGLMDVIEIPEMKKVYTVSVNSHGLYLKEDEIPSDRKLCLVMDKRAVKGGKFQLNLHDGTNILVGKEKSKIKTNDSIVISIPEKKIQEHIPLQKGCNAIVISGKNMGLEGTVTDIIERKTMVERSKAVIRTEKKEIETLKRYIMPLPGKASKTKTITTESPEKKIPESVKKTKSKRATSKPDKEEKGRKT